MMKQLHINYPLYLLLCYSLLSFSLPINAQADKSIEILTAQWLPYVNYEDKAAGSAISVIDQLYRIENTQVNWLHINYDLAYDLVQKEKKLLAFPYFKTQRRSQQVLFSKPLFNVVSHFYYHRQYNKTVSLSALKQYRLGKVAGYSYGEKIDAYLTSAQVFSGERQALAALFANKIDYLPMTESVMNTLLMDVYPARTLLIDMLAESTSHAYLHMIAAKNSEGKKQIDKINSLIDQVQNIKSLQPAPVLLVTPPDIARLITAESYPVVIAQTSLQASPEYFVLPQGTRVLILQWSNKMTEASNSDRIYKNMMDLSRVIILNGPLLGRKLYVKNMHIELL